MTEVIVVCEGRTDETFVRRVLCEPLSERGVYLYSRLIPTSKTGKGGALSPDRVLRNLSNTLRERHDTYVSTFFDLYRLYSEFPGYSPRLQGISSITQAQNVEQSLHQAVLEQADCLPERFLPHIQPYEFESLLFSDTDCLAEVNPEWRSFAADLRSARRSASTPEEINDGDNTHPSARLKRLPGYKKVSDGLLVAEAIGLRKIRSECQHFDAWLSRIENLEPLEQGS